MEPIIRLIEQFIQGIVTGIQPLIQNGNLGYLIPFFLLLGATLIAVSSRNRMSLAGYLVGWIIAITLIGLYMQGNGDNFPDNLTGSTPRSEMITPLFLGLLLGFLLILPFSRWRVTDSQPIMITVVTAMAVVLLFLTYRASNSIAIIHSSGEENLITYRKLYIGMFSLSFGITMLVLIVMSAGSAPELPPPPPPGNQGYM